MTKKRRSWKRFLFWALGIFALAFFGAALWMLTMSFVASDEDLRADISEMGVNGTVQRYTVNADSLRYVRIQNGQAGAPILLMLHGSPGSCGDYTRYWDASRLLSDFEMIAVDRPGYAPDEMPLVDISILRQAEILDAFIRDIGGNRQVALVSHSYGGPVAAALAGMLDTLCLGHVMISPVIDPVSEVEFWYAPMPLVWPFSMIASDGWKMAAIEKGSHKAHLRDMITMLPAISSPTIHIHGTSDRLASIENIAFGKEHFDPSYYTPVPIEKGSHFILWNDAVEEMTIDYLLGLLSDQ